MELHWGEVFSVRINDSVNNRKWKKKMPVYKYNSNNFGWVQVSINFFILWNCFSWLFFVTIVLKTNAIHLRIKKTAISCLMIERISVIKQKITPLFFWFPSLPSFSLTFLPFVLYHQTWILFSFVIPKFNRQTRINPNSADKWRFSNFFPNPNKQKKKKKKKKNNNKFTFF